MKTFPSTNHRNSEKIINTRYVFNIDKDVFLTLQDQEVLKEDIALNPIPFKWTAL